MKNLLKIALVLCLLPAVMFALQRYASRRYLMTALGDNSQWLISDSPSRFLAGGVTVWGEEEPLTSTTEPLILSPDISFMLKEGESAQGHRTVSQMARAISGLPPARRDQTPSGHTRFDSVGPRDNFWYFWYAPTLYLTVTHWGTREVVALAMVARPDSMRDANVRARRERLRSIQDIDLASLNLHLNEWWAHDRAWIRRGGWVVYATITAIAFCLLYRNMILRAARESGRLAAAGGNKIGRTAEAVFDTTKAASQTINDTVNRLNRPPDQ